MIETKDYSEAISEVLELLQLADEEIIKKIPLEVIQKLNKGKSDTYKSKFDEMHEIEEKDLNPKAKAILAFLYRDYICTEEERREFDKILQENSKIQEEKYSIKKFEQKEVEQINNLPVEVKKSFIQKIFEKLFKTTK